MRPASSSNLAWLVVAFASASLVFSGCTRTDYRLQADHDAYHTIAERNGDPRWSAPNHNIEMDARSRYFDIYDSDRPPMPLDDPASHEYMKMVDGKRGWKHWYDNGHRMELENPSWRDAIPSYAEVGEDGALKLDVDTALRLAYVNSPNHQTQLETLYLSALDVSAERFRLDTQFFGGYDAIYGHNGSLIPPQLSYSTLLNRFVITPAIEGDGVENNRVTVGRPFAADPAIQATKRFATAGELLVGFANSFVFEFTGGDVNLASSLANFSFIQPLLRGAGRDIALESLTFEERKMLGNLRAYGQFRQGFYTEVAIGETGVNPLSRGGPSTTMQSFRGSTQVGNAGYVGLLQQRQQVRNSRDNLALQLRTLERLEALEDNQLTDLVQLDQFRQNVESQRAEVLVRENALALALDNYKTSTLGLPPDIEIELDESLIDQFQLFPSEADAVLDALLRLQDDLSLLPDEPPVAILNQMLDVCFRHIEPVKRMFDGAREDLAKMEAGVPTRERNMTEKEKLLYRDDRARLFKRLEDLEKGELGYDLTIAKIQQLRAGLNDNNRRETLNGITAWVSEYRQVVERLLLVPAQARLEVITVEQIDLSPADAFQIALANRLDFMNGRAALVDRWRLVQVNADALQSILNITANGNIRTARNNPFSFRAPTSNVRLGLEFDAPFTRLLERNAFRESLIDYQRNRRAFVQSRDRLHLGLRALIRNLEQQRRDLEIQRRALTIAIRRVDQTQLLLNPARPPVQPGQRPPINPTTAINLLGAQSSLQTTQNNFLAAWLRYYASRMILYRELGIMVLGPEGGWIEYPIGGGEAPGIEEVPRGEALPLPPDVPANWIDDALFRQVEPQPETAAPSYVRPVSYAPPAPPRVQRFPPTDQRTIGYKTGPPRR